MYSALMDRFPDMELDVADGIRSYDAARTMQRLRENLIKGREVSRGLRGFMEPVRRLLDDIQRDSEKFRVARVAVVKISKGVSPYTKMKDYHEYIG